MATSRGHGGITSLHEHLARHCAELPEGLAVATGGGYVVAPPRVDASGLSYRAASITHAIPVLPGWLEISRERAVPSAPPARTASAWADGALRSEPSAVRAALDGTRNNTLNRAAFHLGQLVGAQLLRAEDVAVTLDAAAHAVALAERERAATIRSGLEAGIGRPRFAPEPEWTMGHR